jgi:hypothetical protein
MDDPELLPLCAMTGVLILCAAMIGFVWIREKRPEDRAHQLLEAWLSPAQLEQFRTSGYFDVIGSDSGKLYRVRHGRQMNVDELDSGGKPLTTWCFLPGGRLPVSDVMLAQKIALETDEKITLVIAHKGFVRRA